MRKFRIISGVLWSLLFVYLGYVSYDVHGDEALANYLIFMALSFPSSVGLQFFLRDTYLLDMFLGGAPSYVQEGVLTFLFALVGYFQWFILLPWIIMKVRRLRN